MAVPSTQPRETRVILCGLRSHFEHELTSLCASAGYRVAGKADGQHDLSTIALSVSSDVVLLDVSGWSHDAVVGVCEDLKIAAAVPVLLINDTVDVELFRLSKSAGVAGVLVKPIALAQLVASVELATADEQKLHGKSGTYLIHADTQIDPELAGLSAREREIFNLLAHGHRTNEIGRKLFISPHTVRKHAKTVFRKLGVHSQVELMKSHFERTARAANAR